MELRHWWSWCIPRMQWTAKSRTEIQDAPKSVSVQNLQRTIQQHWRQVGTKLLHGRWLHRKKRYTKCGCRSCWNLCLEWNNHRGPYGSRDVGRGKWGVPQIWQVSHTAWILDTQTQTTKLQSSIQGKSSKPETIYPRYNNPRHLNTTVANQAYTFNGTTLHASVSYAPGTFYMGAPFSTYHPVLYNHQQNQLYTQNQQYHNNSFVEKQNNVTLQSDTTALVKKLQQLILMHKNQDHQVNEVQVVTPKPSTTWDLKAAVELPSTQEDQSELLTAGGTQELTPTAMNLVGPRQCKVRKINHLTMATRGPTPCTFQAKVRQMV